MQKGSETALSVLWVKHHCVPPSSATEAPHLAETPHKKQQVGIHLPFLMIMGDAPHWVVLNFYSEQIC